MPTFSTNDPRTPAVDAEATGFSSVAIKAASQRGHALHAVAGAEGGTIFCESNLENGTALFVRCNANGTAAHFETPNDDRFREIPCVECTANHNEGLKALSGSNHGIHGSTGGGPGSGKAGVFGEAFAASTVGVLGTANGVEGIGVVGFSNGLGGFGVTGNTAG